MLLFDTQQIGNRLLAIRKRLGLTQSEAAELCGLSGRAYADIERGEVNMRIQTVQRICRAFHITPDEILTAENEPLAADQDALFARLQGCRPKEKETALALRPLIGVNLTLPNRVLSQSCLLAGCSGDTSLIPLLMPLLHHPSPAVSTHAAWALSRLQEGISFLSEL